jgi:hypothetical protein
VSVRFWTFIATILEPLRDELPDGELRRFEAALCLVPSGEAIAVLRDVCDSN